MAVGAVSNGSSPYVQNANSGDDDAAQLQQQREILQKQLEAVKSKKKNSQAEQDAAVRQIEQLKGKIAEIDQKIQALSQNQQQGQNISTSAVNSKKGAVSQNDSPLAGVQSATDQLLDTYV